MSDVEDVEVHETPGTPELSEQRLLGFYDRVRRRIESGFERRAGRVGRGTAQALLLVPDLLLLLIRMFLDRDVPRSTRVMIGGALAYFLFPADLSPEIVIGPVGFIDDLIIASTVLAHALGPELETYAAKYWSGSEPLKQTLREISQASNKLLGTDLVKRVDRVVERHLLKKSPDSASS
jgi:uncharacterized membrane protein YkvA (DUF1232 family)